MNNKLVNKYIQFIDEISQKNKYDSNIKHLLYLIIPAFISKYTISKEKIILNTFTQTKIITSKKKNKIIQAFYTSIPSYLNDKIITKKYIIIQNYEKTPLIQLLDNLVHEFNHSINSYNKEIKIKNNILYLRTGLTHTNYSLPELIPQKKRKYLYLRRNSKY